MKPCPCTTGPRCSRTCPCASPVQSGLCRRCVPPNDRTSHQVPGALCPTCNSQNDGAMLIDGEEDRPPEIGDYSVCAYCGQILAYRTTTHVGAVGEDELADIDPHTATVLRSMSRRIKNHQAGKN